MPSAILFPLPNKPTFVKRVMNPVLDRCLVIARRFLERDKAFGDDLIPDLAVGHPKGTKLELSENLAYSLRIRIAPDDPATLDLFSVLVFQAMDAVAQWRAI